MIRTQTFDTVRIQELSPAKQGFVCCAEVCELTDRVPFTGNRDNLLRDDLDCVVVGEQEIRCGGETTGQSAHPVVALDQHRLRRFIPGAALRADVISGGERKHFAVPKGCMIGASAFIGKKTILQPYRKYAGVPAKDIGENIIP